MQIICCGRFSFPPPPSLFFLSPPFSLFFSLSHSSCSCSSSFSKSLTTLIFFCFLFGWFVSFQLQGLFAHLALTRQKYVTPRAFCFAYKVPFAIGFSQPFIFATTKKNRVCLLPFASCLPDEGFESLDAFNFFLFLKKKKTCLPFFAPLFLRATGNQDFDGLPINVSVQQDGFEFFTFLCDRIEVLSHFLSHFYVLDLIFSDVFPTFFEDDEF